MSIFLLSFMSVGVLAQNSHAQSNPKAIKDCMKNAVQQKNTDVKAAKATYTDALEQAKSIQDKGDRKAANEQARNDFKATKKSVLETFKVARKTCLA